MKKRSLWTYLLLLAVACTGALSSCSDSEPEAETPEAETPSATDPYPLPEEYTANKDLTVKPGDSFFNYCNGTWLKNNPIPQDPTRNLGGMYAAEDAMNERVEQLKAGAPDIGAFYAMTDRIHDNAEASRNYIAAQKEKITKPASKEEAYRTIGRMYLDGLNVLEMGVSLIWDKDRLKLVLLPDGETKNDALTREHLKAQERHTPTLTKGGGAASIPVLLAEGMGVDPALLMTTDEEEADWEKFRNEHTLDELYAMMLNSWLEYEAYADAEGLEDYNKTRPEDEQMTMKDLRNDARKTLGYTISYHLQQRFVPQSLKDKFLGYTKEVQAALRRRIGKVDWMSETTKRNAIDKLDHCNLCVAFPDTWHTDCIPTLSDCNTMVEMQHRLKKGNALLMTKLAGSKDLFSYTLTQEITNSNGELVPMDLTLVNAAYSPHENSVTIFPAMLLPPLMPSGEVSEACYYAAFCIIGHEFTHGFDNNGSQWDKYGVKKNWWTVADKMNFEDRKANLIRTYDHMELDPVREPLFYCNGTRTQGENIADLGGFLAALDAYQARLDREGFKGETRNEQIRKFYESYAHVWCVEYGQKKFDILKHSDVHAHGRLRVNGVVMNTDMWYSLYGVNKDHLLYLPKERRAYIW